MKEKVKSLLLTNDISIDNFKFISRKHPYTKIEEVWIYRKNGARLEKILVFPNGDEKKIYKNDVCVVCTDEILKNENDTEILILQLQQYQRINRGNYGKI